MTVRDLLGQRFGRLVAISRDGSTKSGAAIWVWQCDCGNTKSISATNVTQGLTVSCGCRQQEARVKHGLSQTLTYNRWRAMKDRVLGTGAASKKYYKKRRITIDPRWVESYENFLADIGECPPGLTLDRKDNDLGYTKDNCRWATRAQQSANTSRTHRVIYHGDQTCLAHACRAAGASYRDAMYKMAGGMTAQQVVDTYP